MTVSVPTPARTLEELVGEHTMTVTPRMDVRHPFDTDANGCAFHLNGVTYFVFEDPNDGYRSTAMELMSQVGEFYQLGIDVEYIRPALKVTAKMNGGVLTFRSEDDKIVFRVGTDNSDDYYPWYVAEWTPPGERA